MFLGRYINTKRACALRDSAEGASHDGGEMLEPQRAQRTRRRTGTLSDLSFLCASAVIFWPGDEIPPRRAGANQARRTLLWPCNSAGPCYNRRACHPESDQNMTVQDALQFIQIITPTSLIVVIILQAQGRLGGLFGSGDSWASPRPSPGAHAVPDHGRPGGGFLANAIIQLLIRRFERGAVSCWRYAWMVDSGVFCGENTPLFAGRDDAQGLRWPFRRCCWRAPCWSPR